MALKNYKPRSPGMRFRVSQVRTHLSKEKPVAHLTIAKNSAAGRNNQGRITVRHRGGGVRRRFRVVDFLRDKHGIPAKVAALCYDPNRTANLALLNYADGEKRYILAPIDLKVGDTVVSGEGADIKPGNALPIRNIPLGTLIHNVEIVPGRGGQLVRSAGDAAQLMAKEGANAQVRLPSGEVRMIPMDAKATIGTVSNADHSNVRIGKAGRSRHMGIRPTVRGVVMNPCDHPHGGGEGKSPVGLPAPVTPWGKPALGLKTRKHKKYSDKKIVKRAGKK